MDGPPWSAREVVEQTSRCNVAAVTEAQKGTQADSELRAALSKRGVTVTATQLKRWRQAGLIPSPIRVAAGRGQGRRSTHYPPGTVDLAAAVATVVTTMRMPLDHAAAILFWGGVDVPFDRIITAYKNIFDRIELELAGKSDRKDAADKIAQNMIRRAPRTKIGPSYIARNNVHGARQTSAFGTAITAAASALFADGSVDQIAADAITQIAGAPPVNADALDRQLQLLNVTSLRSRLDLLTLEMLIHTRNMVADKEATATQPPQDAATATAVAPLLRQAESVDYLGSAMGNLAITLIQAELIDTP